jgi:O-antigen/teichoic acid export membrane protein
VPESPTPARPSASAGQELLRHMLIYGSGHVLLRLGSVLLLPFYTRMLSPAEYGIIGLVDLVAGMFGILVAGQVAAAATRQHYSDRWVAQPGVVWWNAQWLLVGLVTVVLMPAMLVSGPIADVVLGAGVPDGALYMLLGLWTLLLIPFEELGLAYLQAQRRSVQVTVFSVCRLLLNVVLNVALLWWWDLGILGVLIGNLATGVVAALLSLSLTVWRLPVHGPQHLLIRALWGFSGPLFLTGALALAMHQSGRLYLRAYGDLDDVGVFGLAQQIGQGIGGLILAPFGMIFVPLALQMGTQAGSGEFLRDTFRVYFGIVALIMFAVSALAPELLGVLVSDEYMGAADAIPLVCLAYLLFSLHSHFSITVQVAERTTLLVPTALVATIVCVAGSLLLVPAHGVMGAAFVLVLTFFAYSFGGLLIYRRVRDVGYPLGQFMARLVGLIVTFFCGLAWRSWVPDGFGFVFPLVAIAGWTVILARQDDWLRRAAFLRPG